MKRLTLSQLVTKAGEELLTKISSKDLMPILNAYCEAKKISTPGVVYVGDVMNKTKLRKETVMGKYSVSSNTVTMRIGRNKKDTIETLMHELTHAYQHAYHPEMIRYGKAQQKEYTARFGRYDVYKESVHEQHARVCAKYLVKIAMECGNDYTKMKRRFKQFNMEQVFHEIRYNTLTVSNF